ncbi:MAG: helix-turn-helix transcriptional regulator [Gemmatimonadetes bacterium]|nr:helix-turn-helix transcriptional regulator [Gemmatimonadota bacterium]
MVQRASSVNPSVLLWARERAGLSVAEVAERLGKPPEVIAAWESGEAFPAYGQLERLAETLYKRPVALFFLPSPPEEAPVRSEFRTLPDADLEALGPDTRYALRDAHAFQASLRELSGGAILRNALFSETFSLRGAQTLCELLGKLAST